MRVKDDLFELLMNSATRVSQNVFPVGAVGTEKMSQQCKSQGDDRDVRGSSWFAFGLLGLNPEAITCRRSATQDTSPSQHRKFTHTTLGI